jgi:hypothetical protein
LPEREEQRGVPYRCLDIDEALEAQGFTMDDVRRRSERNGWHQAKSVELEPLYQILSEEFLKRVSVKKLAVLWGMKLNTDDGGIMFFCADAIWNFFDDRSLCSGDVFWLLLTSYIPSLTDFSFFNVRRVLMRS